MLLLPGQSACVVRACCRKTCFIHQVPALVHLCLWGWPGEGEGTREGLLKRGREVLSGGKFGQQVRLLRVFPLSTV
jgi:hypothetical protein